VQQWGHGKRGGLNFFVERKQKLSIRNLFIYALLNRISSYRSRVCYLYDVIYSSERSLL
jgi:hypothetical protein